MSDFIRGWNAAIDAAAEHCEEVRQDRLENPPVWQDERRKFTAEDLVKIERATASSCKVRIESLRKPEPGPPTKSPTPKRGCCPEWMRTGRHG